MFFVFKILLSALVIAGASWLSGKYPKLAGFIIALPLATLIALVLSYTEHKKCRNNDYLCEKYSCWGACKLFFLYSILFCQKFKYEFLAYLLNWPSATGRRIFCS